MESYNYFLTLLFWTLVLLHCGECRILAQSNSQKTSVDYYPVDLLPVPEKIELAASGIAFNPQGDMMVSTRKDIWRISDPGGDTPIFERFAYGLLEPLGIVYSDSAWFVVQMGELTKIEDRNKDRKADSFQTLYKWPLAGNYHEYSFGPEILPNGKIAVTHALTMPGVGISLAKWRGWMLHISKNGDITPFATGLRSPNGIGTNAEGDIFYSDNQGRWIGSGRISHLEKGDFAGNPEGLRWSHSPKSPLDLDYDSINDLEDYPWRPMHSYSNDITEMKLPAVWIPHPILGVSTSDILLIEDDSQVGPFAGQLLVGDFGHAAINRVYLEKVKGEYQGAVFRFREGFSSGIQNIEWGPDNNLYVSMRGWVSAGDIARMSWNGQTPFEMKSIRAESNGFTITFTKPIDAQMAVNIENYQVTDFTYPYHRHYYSSIMNRESKTVGRVEALDDQRTIRLYVNGLREGYINQIKVNNVHSQGGEALLHSTGYYTLNNLPDGDRSVAIMGKRDGAANSSNMEKSSNKKVTKMPTDWTNGPDQTIEITARPGLKFDRRELKVKAGSRVALTLHNNDDMQHNLVVVVPGTSDQVGQAALQLGLKAEELEYVPITENVLYHSSLLGASESETIYFQTPNTPGDYEFICSYAGHYTTMKGILKVE